MEVNPRSSSSLSVSAHFAVSTSLRMMAMSRSNPHAWGYKSTSVDVVVVRNVPAGRDDRDYLLEYCARAHVRWSHMAVDERCRNEPVALIQFMSSNAAHRALRVTRGAVWRGSKLSVSQLAFTGGSFLKLPRCPVREAARARPPAITTRVVTASVQRKLALTAGHDVKAVPRTGNAAAAAPRASSYAAAASRPEKVDTTVPRAGKDAVADPRARSYAAAASRATKDDTIVPGPGKVATAAPRVGNDITTKAKFRASVTAREKRAEFQAALTARAQRSAVPTAGNDATAAPMTVNYAAVASRAGKDDITVPRTVNDAALKPDLASELTALIPSELDPELPPWRKQQPESLLENVTPMRTPDSTPHSTPQSTPELSPELPHLSVDVRQQSSPGLSPELTSQLGDRLVSLSEHFKLEHAVSDEIWPRSSPWSYALFLDPFMFRRSPLQ